MPARTPFSTPAADRLRLTLRMKATLVVFAAVMFTGGTDLTKVTVGLPRITADLSAGPLQGLWIADVYGLVAGALLLPAAVLADTVGRKRVYLAGLLLAAATAAVAATAPSATVLVLARAVQGASSAMLIAGTVTIIRVTFPGIRLRAVAYGVWAASFSVGSAFGPLVGGALVEWGHWRWLFAVNVPVLLLCAVAAAMVLAETRNPDPPVFDLPSVLASVSGVALVVAGLKGLAQEEVPVVLSLAGALTGALLLVLFVLRQLRLPRAFLDVRLFRLPSFTASTVVVLIANGAFAGVLFVLTQRFQEVEGMTAIGAGWALMPLALASALGAVLAPRVQDLLAPERTLMVGVGAAATGLGMLALAGPGAGLRVAAMVVLGLGTGVIMTIGANLIMSSAPEDRTADAGAIQESAFTIGAGAGIALLGASSLVLARVGEGSVDPAAIYGPGADQALRVVAAGFALVSLVAIWLLRRGTHQGPGR
ncbi:MFS transporter [Serinicoccus sp. LYQ131]|uniref:MFS transporter n=1 Tax=Serinicoccus sp. LYQ131 TaxID=3378797 RepID=UPI00385381D7